MPSLPRAATPEAPAKAADRVLTASVGHAENFPVASWLCPPAIRPAVVAIYHFARTADDLADEGDAPAAQRLAALATYRDELERCLRDQSTREGHWQPVFERLRRAVHTHHLPAQPLHDLLSAFEQDVRYTAQGLYYADHGQLLDYCSRSANPVGRLLLHLYGVTDAAALRQSDQICSALQLINFWQDLSVDLPRQRHYLPQDLLERHGLARTDFAPGDPKNRAPDAATPVRMAAAVAELCAQARALMQAGAPLARRIPGRAGWELRLVVQGGIRILDHLQALDHRSWQTRPRLRAGDLPRMVFRAVRM